jgi:hypothetical protein
MRQTYRKTEGEQKADSRFWQLWEKRLIKLKYYKHIKLVFRGKPKQQPLLGHGRNRTAEQKPSYDFKPELAFTLGCMKNSYVKKLILEEHLKYSRY